MQFITLSVEYSMATRQTRNRLRGAIQYPLRAVGCKGEYTTLCAFEAQFNAETTPQTKQEDATDFQCWVEPGVYCLHLVSAKSVNPHKYCMCISFSWRLTHRFFTLPSPISNWSQKGMFSSKKREKKTSTALFLCTNMSIRTRRVIRSFKFLNVKRRKWVQYLYISTFFPSLLWPHTSPPVIFISERGAFLSPSPLSLSAKKSRPGTQPNDPCSEVKLYFRKVYFFVAHLPITEEIFKNEARKNRSLGYDGFGSSDWPTPKVASERYIHLPYLIYSKHKEK